MGLAKNWQFEEAERERHQDVREWLESKRGREVSEWEISAAAWDEFELDEAFFHALDKDG